MQNKNNFGLVAKSTSPTIGDLKTLNFKIKVDSKFYDEWISLMARLSPHFIGGGCAVVLSCMVEAMPDLRELADTVSIEPVAKKGGSK